MYDSVQYVFNIFINPIFPNWLFTPKIIVVEYHLQTFFLLVDLYAIFHWASKNYQQESFLRKRISFHVGGA